MARVLGASLAALLACACGGEAVDADATGGRGGAPADGGDGGDAGAGGSAPVGPIDWSECGFTAEGRRVESACTRVSVALRPGGSERVELFLRRVPARGERKAQVWVLQGGPGAPADSVLAMAARLAGAGFEAYALDYRGTGRSGRVACDDPPRDNAVAPACVAEVVARFGDDLSAYGTDAIARDLLALMDATAEPGVPRRVWAVSYGTLLTTRLFHLRPDVADAVVLDSPCHPSRCAMDRLPDRYDLVASRLFTACAESPTCRGKLGPEPLARAIEVLGRVSAGHCDLGDDVDEHRFLAQMLALSVDNSAARAVGPAAIYRADRCSDADRAALRTLLTNSGYADDPPHVIEDDGDRAPLVQLSILRSELFAPGITAAELAAEAARHTIGDFAAVTQAEIMAGLPFATYEVDPRFAAWPPVEVPLLAMVGTLDVRTPPEALVDFPYDGPGQLLVEHRWGGHGLIATTAPGAPGESCGVTLARAFLADPSAVLDTACATPEGVPSFAGSATLAQAVFGTDDLWD